MCALFSRRRSVSEEALLFSEVQGAKLYYHTGEFATLPDNLQRGEPNYPVFQNLETGELFFAKVMQPSMHNRAFVRYARTLVDDSLILWPRDVLSYPAGAAPIYHNLEYYYEFGEPPQLFRETEEALLFSCNSCLAGASAREYLHYLEDTAETNYRNPEVLKLARLILEAYSRLNKKGFLYLDFNLDRFQITGNEYIYFDCSNLIYRIPDTRDVEWLHENEIGRPWYPLEFAEPAVMRGIWKYADLRTQNYSLSALLFYLLFGIYAYKGSLMDDYSTDSELHYYETFEDYHQMDIFVFDPENQSNALGTFSHEKKILQLWEEAPEQIKEAFVQALGTANAERKNDKDMNPGPDAWIELFRQAGWM